MAFSFRAGTNWCHDFPKLARESGFCFNVHRTRVRVDWNRIGSIDIDRVIRERDFLTVDDNVNNVVDYSLESEYDVKILDPNFVKLFRLAQLSVEYLLYCKQYLDHSVIILKDELRSKLEENTLMKKEIKVLTETIKDLKDKMRDRNKMIESKLCDSNGELFKCPHCVKTFIAAPFVSAHITRRHAHLSDLYMSASSPAHEQYRAETEKLHNEIKTLKERLNQTERIIRHESDRVMECGKTDTSSKPDTYEKGEYTNDKDREERLKEQQRKYQDEIASLKNMLFIEIRNLKQKESSISPIRQVENEMNDINLKELIKKQEQEIHTLRDQLREKLTPDLRNVQEKLQIQEQHWLAVNDRLERQHNLDTENLSTQLKISQDAAREMKELYESKVSELEMHSKSQAKMLEAQGSHLEQLTRNLWESREIGSTSINVSRNDLQDGSSSHDMIRKVQSFKEIKSDAKVKMNSKYREDLVCEEIGSLSSHDSQKILSSPKPKTKYSMGSGDCMAMPSLNRNLESSEDTESIRNNDLHRTSAVNFKKHRREKKQDTRRDNRTLIENLNAEDFPSIDRDKKSHTNPSKNSYRKDIVDKVKTSTENQTQASWKHRPNSSVRHLVSSKPVFGNKKSNQNSKNSIRDVKSIQNVPPDRAKPHESHSEVKLTSELNTPPRPMEKSENTEATDGETETESESEDSESDSRSASENDDSQSLKRSTQHAENRNLKQSLKDLLDTNSAVLQELNEHLREVFDNKLKDLGIDPEWNGVPYATFEQKMETVAHHQKINSKKINGYNRIRQKILKDISHVFVKRRAEPRDLLLEKLSPLDRIMNKVKHKTANVLKQKSFELRTPILKSQVTTPRDRVARPMSNLEILPKKMRQSEIHIIASENSSNLQNKETEIQTKIRPISVKNVEHQNDISSEIFSHKQSNRVVDRKELLNELDSSTSVDNFSQSHDKIEYFSKSNVIPRTEKITSLSEGIKLTSTPIKSVDYSMEHSYSSIEEESDKDWTNREKASSLPASPKNNKSVLKSATGSVGSLVKKKVLFDLEQSLDNSGKSLSQFPMQEQPPKQLFPEYDIDNKAANEDEWNISNMSDDDLNPQKEKTPSLDNIKLKTSQSNGIARISQKIQDQLSIARQKPVGAVEAMFLAKPKLKEINKDNAQYRSSTSIASSILESPKKPLTHEQYVERNKLPQPAPRTLRNDESDIESDIEELLQMG
ncbi:cilium assembly protein DZIP1L [Athalia rosae]|uniref:cilium assembly protein DZIP1L n=1 Tax=Athalia rosae TaxID=37344 RepID=UPI002033561D|nr:cilium assembly protein DZIP1L [Athalia rosae]